MGLQWNRLTSSGRSIDKEVWSWIRDSRCGVVKGFAATAGVGTVWLVHYSKLSHDAMCGVHRRDNTLIGLAIT